MMRRKIKVRPVYRKSRGYWILRWSDDTGKREQRIDARTQRAAERAARDKEDELQNQLSRVKWSTFCEKYEVDKLRHHPDRTQRQWQTVRNWLERLFDLQYVSDFDEERAREFVREVYQDNALATVRSYVATLKAALNWGHKQSLVERVPHIDKPRSPRGAKLSGGRGLSGEEFDRMLDKIPDAIDWSRATNGPRTERRNEGNVDGWQFLLRGLWLSGLRLDEALRLTWGKSDFCLGSLDATWPRFQMSSEAEKGARDRDLTIDPQFVAMLRTVSKSMRRGFVFKPQLWKRGKHESVRRADTVSKIISRAGELARIKVDENSRTGKVKFASAKDLRRSAADRWKSLPLPLLQHMMRHQSADTTLKFYAAQNSDELAREIYSHLENSQEDDPKSDGRES